MKKLLTILLILIFLGQNSAFAQLLDSANLNKTQFATHVEVSREEIKLNSYLKESHFAYLYSITNLENFPIEIIEIKGWSYPENSIKNIKKARKELRFPHILLEPTIGIVAIALLPIDWPFFPLFFVYDSDPPNFGFIQIVNRSFIRPIKNTIAAPYYCIKDRSDDKKALKEGEMFNYSDSAILTIKPKEKIQFAVLFHKSYKGIMTNNGLSTLPMDNELSMTIVNTETKQEYVLKK